MLHPPHFLSLFPSFEIGAGHNKQTALCVCGFLSQTINMASEGLTHEFKREEVLKKLLNGKDEDEKFTF